MEANVDVANLKSDMEQHLEKNPDENAPEGFRDRFEAAVAELESAENDEERDACHAQLRQIRKEAEAAAKAAGMAGEEGSAAEAGASDDTGGPAAEEQTVAPGEPTPEAPPDAVGEATGFLQRYGLPLLIVLVVLVAAYLVLRSQA